MKRSGGRNRSSGFTLLETLIVVAILVILLGLSMVGVARYKDHLKITELDNAARDICMAAENRAVLLQNSGATVKLLTSTDVSGNPVLPKLSLADGKDVRKLSSKDADTTSLNNLLPVGSIDPSLRDGDEHFVILYDEDTHHVREVFYAEKEIIGELDDFREKSRSERVSLFRAGKCLVGYYGGDLAEPISTKPRPLPGWRCSLKTATS